MSEQHLDDEAISDAIDDGRADPHLDDCASCRARFDALRGGVEAMSRPVVPLDQAAREAMIDRAIAAGATTTRSTEVVALGSRRKGLGAAQRWMGVAAAVAVLAGVGSVIAASRSDKPSLRSSNDATLASPALEAADAAVLEGEDMGAQTDPKILGQLVSSRLSSATTIPSAAGAAPAADSETRQLEGGGAAKSTGTLPCIKVARSEYSSAVRRLVYGAPVDWQGTPSVVLAYEQRNQKDSPLSYLLLILARSDCHLLTSIAQKS